MVRMMAESHISRMVSINRARQATIKSAARLTIRSFRSDTKCPSRGMDRSSQTENLNDEIIRSMENRPRHRLDLSASTRCCICYREYFTAGFSILRNRVEFMSKIERLVSSNNYVSLFSSSIVNLVLSDAIDNHDRLIRGNLIMTFRTLAIILSQMTWFFLKFVKTFRYSQIRITGYNNIFHLNNKLKIWKVYLIMMFRTLPIPCYFSRKQIVEMKMFNRSKMKSQSSYLSNSWHDSSNWKHDCG